MSNCEPKGFHAFLGPRPDEPILALLDIIYSFFVSEKNENTKNISSKSSTTIQGEKDNPKRSKSKKNLVLPEASQQEVRSIEQKLLEIEQEIENIQGNSENNENSLNEEQEKTPEKATLNTDQSKKNERSNSQSDTLIDVTNDANDTPQIISNKPNEPKQPEKPLEQSKLRPQVESIYSVNIGGRKFHTNQVPMIITDCTNSNNKPNNRHEKQKSKRHRHSASPENKSRPKTADAKLATHDPALAKHTTVSEWLAKSTFHNNNQLSKAAIKDHLRPEYGKRQSVIGDSTDSNDFAKIRNSQPIATKLKMAKVTKYKDHSEIVETFSVPKNLQIDHQHIADKGELGKRKFYVKNSKGVVVPCEEI